MNPITVIVQRYLTSNEIMCLDIENALHALALNEQRQHFAPTMWYLRKEVIKQLESEGKKVPKLKQCWFPGYHIDVGGNYGFLDVISLLSRNL